MHEFNHLGGDKRKCSQTNESHLNENKVNKWDSSTKIINQGIPGKNYQNHHKKSFKSKLDHNQSFENTLVSSHVYDDKKYRSLENIGMIDINVNMGKIKISKNTKKKKNNIIGLRKKIFNLLEKAQIESNENKRELEREGFINENESNHLKSSLNKIESADHQNEDFKKICPKSLKEILNLKISNKDEMKYLIHKDISFEIDRIPKQIFLKINNQISLFFKDTDFCLPNPKDYSLKYFNVIDNYSTNQSKSLYVAYEILRIEKLIDFNIIQKANLNNFLSQITSQLSILSSLTEILKNTNKTELIPKKHYSIIYKVLSIYFGLVCYSYFSFRKKLKL